MFWIGGGVFTVHPRRCGELGHKNRTPAEGLGSSPQVRGTLIIRKSWEVSRRFIPAGAGNSAIAECSDYAKAVHPRRCGELNIIGDSGAGKTGSSPQVRGTLVLPLCACTVFRFIPAGAGNSSPKNNSQGNMSVHPRRCGELRPHLWAVHIKFGSSPQVRGTLKSEKTLSALGRFIPAGAGNSALVERNRTARSVHPRRCGELSLIFRYRGTRVGSSPQVRGTRRLNRGTQVVQRFIPAGAGNSHPSPSRLTSQPVHPRRCGELLRSTLTMFSLGGSSPQVRGTHSTLFHLFLLCRFIPAGAGNSSYLSLVVS